MFGETAIFDVMIWFIIQFKQPSKNLGCLEFQEGIKRFFKWGFSYLTRDIPIC